MLNFRHSLDTPPTTSYNQDNNNQNKKSRKMSIDMKKFFRHSLSMLLLFGVYQNAFVSFRSEDIEAAPLMFRVLQASIITTMFSASHFMRLNKHNGDSAFFSAFMGSVASITFVVMTSVITYDENFDAARSSPAYPHIFMLYSIPPKLATLFLIASEASKNIEEMFKMTPTESAPA